MKNQYLKNLLFIALSFFVQVSLAQNNWTWIKGDSTQGSAGLYGTLGVPSATNTPGSRWSSLNWTDQNGNLWLYSGNGAGTISIQSGGGGVLADLWKYDISLGQWVWVRGSQIINQAAAPVYGTKGVASASNTPGSKGASATWADTLGNLWLYGGGTIWKYNIASNMWTWVHGDTINFYANYGTKGVMTSSNVPGGRSVMSFWKDASGNLWIFGGFGVINSSTTSEMNDLWKYDVSANQWVWMSGSSSHAQLGVYGTMGVASSTTTPSARRQASTWTDKNGFLWLYGGTGYDAAGNYGGLSDLWKYNISTNQWTWVNGSNLMNQQPVYGVQNVFSSTNNPGGLAINAYWIDSTGNNLWLGNGIEANSYGTGIFVNTMWKYNISLNQWTWTKGSNFLNTIDHVGVYGTKGTPAMGNVPGGRYWCNTWQGNNGEFWLFGGISIGTANNACCVANPMNDLWRFDPCYSCAVTVTNTSSAASLTMCANSSTTLSAAGSGTLSWYNINSNNLLGTGNTFVTPTLSTTTTFMVVDNANSSLPTSITVTVTPNPTLNIVATKTVICPGAAVTLTAFANAAFSLWNTGATNYITAVSPTVTTTYSVLMTAYPSGCTTNGVKTVSVAPAPPTLSVSASNTLICQGSATTLTALSNAATYSWSNGNTNYSTVVTPSVTTNYSISVSNSGSICPNSSVVTVSVYPTKPTLTVSSTNTMLCVGDTVTLTALSNANTYSWSNGGTNNSISVTPSITSTYSVVVTDNSTGCTNSGIKTISVSPTLTLNLSSSSATLCSGGYATLTAMSNANSYTWSTNSYTWGGGSSASLTVDGPTVTTTYSVIVANSPYACINSSVITVSVSPSPTLNIISTTNAACPGNSATLTVFSNANTYSWSTGGTSNSIVVTPTAYTVYSVTVTDTSLGCTKGGYSSIYVYATPTLNIASINTLICQGSTVILTAQTNANTYSWNNGSTGNAISVTPSVTTTYSVLVTNSGGCTNSGVKTISVVPKPTLSVSASNTLICPGNSTTLTILSDAATYSWVGGNGNSSVVVTPNVTSYYYITVSNPNSICTNTSIITVSVSPNPTLTVSSTTTALCQGNSATLTALSNANTYSWSNGGTNNSISVTPSVTSTYSVLVTNSSGCTNSGVRTISVSPTPTLSVSANNTSICPGNSTTLTALSDAATYSWSGGNTSYSILVTPSVITNYSVLVSNLGSICTNSSIITVSVYPIPTLTVSSTNTTLCVGDMATLTALSNANTYSWSNGSTNNSISITPSITSTYSVLVTDNSTGCTNSGIKIISVVPLPTLNIVTTNTVLCQGSSATLTALSNANVYSWSNGSTTNITSVTPNVTSTYSVVVIDNASGCTNSGIKIISVVPLPTLNIVTTNTALCQGSSATLTALSNVNAYLWNNGSTNNSISVTPSATSTYSILVTDNSSSCSNNSVITINVYSIPTLNIFSSDSILCPSETATLNVVGANSYTWNTGNNGSTLVITPSATSVYTVTGIDINGCKNSSAFTQSVSACLGIIERNNYPSALKIYPNPNNGTFTIEASENTHIVIINSVGQIVLEQTTSSSKTEISLQNKANGIYFVKAGNVAQKIVKE